MRYSRILLNTLAALPLIMTAPAVMAQEKPQQPPPSAGIVLAEGSGSGGMRGSQGYDRDRSMMEDGTSGSMDQQQRSRDKMRPSSPQGSGSMGGSSGSGSGSGMGSGGPSGTGSDSERGTGSGSSGDPGGSGTSSGSGTGGGASR